MSADDFECPPSVELLRYLAGESLRQPDVLSVAVRLWVMLRSLYGADGDPVKLDLEQVFSFTDWRQNFFAGYNHPMNDAIPEIHDRRCPCAKTLEQWIFEPKIGIPQKEWQKAFFQHYPIPEAEMDRLLCPVKWVFHPETGIPESEWRQSFYKKFTPEETDKLLRKVKYPARERHKNRPFGFSRKTLQKDFHTLAR